MLEKLEDRRLLAVTTPPLVSGDVVFNGDAQADVFELSVNDQGRLEHNNPGGVFNSPIDLDSITPGDQSLLISEITSLRYLDGGNNDTLSFVGNNPFTINSADLRVEAQTIVIGANTVVSSDTGSIELVASRNLEVLSFAEISTMDGGILLSANANEAATGSFVGINAEPASVIQTSGSGNVVMTGSGGDDPTSPAQYGVFLSGLVESTSTAADAGTVTITGTGGSGTRLNYGVYIPNDSNLRSDFGDITIQGQGGFGTDLLNIGVYVRGNIQSTGIGPNAAAISIMGTGGTGVLANALVSDQYGVQIGRSNNSRGTQIASVSGDISISGQGGDAVGRINRGVYIREAEIVSTGLGSDAALISIDGVGVAGDGVDLFNGTRLSSRDGDIAIAGQAGDATARGRGVNITNAEISSIGVGVNAAKILINGTGNFPASDPGVRVAGNDWDLTSVDGDIAIIGSGAEGIQVSGEGIIASTGIGENAATITIEGTGRSDGATSDRALGVDFQSIPEDESSVTSVDGDIVITGIASGSSGAIHRGVRIRGFDVVSTGSGPDAANITIEGVRGVGDVGVLFGVSLEGDGQVVSSRDGAISILGDSDGGQGGSGTGISSAGMLGGVQTTGPITLKANSIDLVDESIIQSTGDLVIQPLTRNTSIGLGGGTGELNLNDSEISRFVDGFNSITIGDTSGGTGTVDIETSTFFDSVTIAGGTINDRLGTDLIADENMVTLVGSIEPGQSPGILTVEGDLFIADDNRFEVEIGGPQAGSTDNDHDQIQVTGAVTISPSVTLDVALFGGFIPASRQPYVIVDNDGTDEISGSFAGLPEGASIEVGDGAFQISYSGGDGNDVALIWLAPTTLGITDVNVLEDAADTSIDLFAVFDDADDPVNTLSFNVTENSNASLFDSVNFDAVSGLLTLDYSADANGFSDLSVRATNSDGYSVETTFRVNVTPVNDAPAFTAVDPPVVIEDSGLITISGWATFDPGVENESTQKVLAYQVSGISNPGLFATTPSIDSDGNLSYQSVANAFGTSTIEVSVQDDGGTGNGGEDTSASETFSITVESVEDAPKIESPSTVSIEEGQSFILDIEASDAEGETESGGGLTYSLSGGVDAGLFSIDTNTGNLVFNAEPDFEIPLDADADNVYELQVTVIDSLSFTDTQAISVTVLDVNDAPVLTGPSIAEVAEIDRFVADFDATDQDGDTPGDGLFFIVRGGADAASFTIDFQTGVLSFASNPNFENPSDANSDNVYEVEIAVLDSGSPTGRQEITTQVVLVTVTDVAEPTVVIAAITEDGGAGLEVDAQLMNPEGRPISGTVSLVQDAFIDLSQVPENKDFIEGDEFILGVFDGPPELSPGLRAGCGDSSAGPVTFNFEGSLGGICGGGNRFRDPGWTITVQSKITGQDYVLSMQSWADPTSYIRSVAVLSVPYTERLPGSVDLTGLNLATGESYVLAITAEDDRGASGADTKSFIYQGEDFLQFSSEPTVMIGGSIGTETDDLDQRFSWSVEDVDDDLTSVEIVVFKDGIRIDSLSGLVDPTGQVDFNHQGVGLFEIALTATDNAGSVVTADRAVLVSDDDTTSPLISISGSSGTELEIDTNVYSWNVEDASGLSALSVTVTRDAGDGPVAIYTTADIADATGSFHFDDFGVGVYELLIVATDADEDWAGDGASSSAGRTSVVGELFISTTTRAKLEVDDGEWVTLHRADVASTSNGDVLFDHSQLSHPWFSWWTPNLNAFHMLADGSMILSTDSRGSIGDQDFRDGGLVRFYGDEWLSRNPGNPDHLHQSAQMIATEEQLFGKRSLLTGVDAISMAPDGNVVISLDRNRSLADGNAYHRGDLIKIVLREDGALASSALYFDHQVLDATGRRWFGHWFHHDVNVDGAHVLEDGRILLSVDRTATAGTDGRSYKDGDVFVYDPTTNLAELLFDEDSFRRDEDVDAVFLGIGNGELSLLDS
ncbi:MAG: cadherin domain-containing protein [Planctomycetota bacterium]